MTSNHNNTLDEHAINARFDRVASGFDDVSFAHLRAAKGLLDRMELMQLKPQLIVDAGSGTGWLSREVRKRFRRTPVISLDRSVEMLRQAKSNERRFVRERCVRADARAMPLADDTVDIVVSNMLLPWLGEPDAMFRECSRVLKTDSPLLFSSLGPDSFVELRNAWRSCGIDDNVPGFVDMHDLGDALLRCGFTDPVLDVETLTVTYSGFRPLWHELRASGSGNPLAGRRQSLTGKSVFRKMESALLEASDGDAISVSLELVFGHAWAARGTRDRGSSKEFTVGLSEIGRRSG